MDEAVTTQDGTQLAARFHEAADAVGTVLIVSAMGVSQSFYDRLARWLATQRFNVVTFDYRGVGRSRRGPLRGFRADVFDWARLDTAAMVDAAADRAPSLPLTWIGHSLGGQIFPFVPNHHRVAKVITVASGSGYWRENAPGLRRVVWWMWYIAAPVSLKLFGYFPGRRLRKIGDLPHGVMSQWRRWCLDPEYVVGAEGEMARAAFAAVRTPMTSLSFTDDEYMSARNVESLHGFYANAPQSRTRLAPEQVGMRRVGHFGFFRSTAEAPLWREYLLPALAT